MTLHESLLRNVYRGKSTGWLFRERAKLLSPREDRMATITARAFSPVFERHCRLDALTHCEDELEERGFKFK